jgi:hypothetical protein
MSKEFWMYSAFVLMFVIIPMLALFVSSLAYMQGQAIARGKPRIWMAMSEHVPHTILAFVDREERILWIRSSNGESMLYSFLNCPVCVPGEVGFEPFNTSKMNKCRHIVRHKCRIVAFADEESAPEFASKSS